MIFQQKCSSCYILSTDQISLPGCLYFLRYWTICVLQLFVIQVVTSWILKLALPSNRAIFSTWPKSHDKNLNILRTKRAFKVQHFSSFLKVFQLSKMSQTLECVFNCWAYFLLWREYFDTCIAKRFVTISLKIQTLVNHESCGIKFSNTW